jgi:hypothetical protein
MARHCWQCDSPISQGYKRWMTVGYGDRTFASVGRSGLRGGGSSGTYTGLRTLCARCALAEDDRERSRQNSAQIVIALCGIGLFGLMWWGSTTTKHEPPVTYAEAPNHAVIDPAAMDAAVRRIQARHANDHALVNVTQPAYVVDPINK